MSANTEVSEPMTTGEAQAYQRLRGHLADLRLTAAGEALSGVLDTARDEDLPLVATGTAAGR